MRPAPLAEHLGQLVGLLRADMLQEKYMDDVIDLVNGLPGHIAQDEGLVIPVGIGLLQLSYPMTTS